MSNKTYEGTQNARGTQTLQRLHTKTTGNRDWQGKDRSHADSETTTDIYKEELGSLGKVDNKTQHSQLTARKMIRS